MLLGNLGADPELRTVGGGHRVLKLSLATTVSFFDKNKQQRQERTEWHTVKVWGKRGEALSPILNKGARVLILGRIESYNYETKDGQKRSATEIIAEDVWLAGSSRAPSPPSHAAANREQHAPVANGSALPKQPAFANVANELPF
ncbi:MAG: single-stranded DNA-binding protein [Polyangiaceae bacterium]|nr:single-stranded DNA-binding protein [Polyangiaceae bacterium]